MGDYIVIKRHVHWKDGLLNSTRKTAVVIFTCEKTDASAVPDLGLRSRRLRIFIYRPPSAWDHRGLNIVKRFINHLIGVAASILLTMGSFAADLQGPEQPIPYSHKQHIA